MLNMKFVNAIVVKICLLHVVHQEQILTKGISNKRSGIQEKVAKNITEIYKEGICEGKETCYLIDSVPESLRDLRTRTCMCDRFCSQYGDCCSDAKFFNEIDQKKFLDFQCLDEVYVLSSCPKTWRNNKVARLCEKSRELEPEEVILELPVMDLLTNVSYGNVFCAQCHGVKDYKEWMMSAVCHEGALQLPSSSSHRPILEEEGHHSVSLARPVTSSSERVHHHPHHNQSVILGRTVFKEEGGNGGGKMNQEPSGMDVRMNPLQQVDIPHQINQTHKAKIPYQAHPTPSQIPQLSIPLLQVHPAGGHLQDMYMDVRSSLARLKDNIPQQSSGDHVSPKLKRAIGQTVDPDVIRRAKYAGGKWVSASIDGSMTYRCYFIAHVAPFLKNASRFCAPAGTEIVANCSSGHVSSAVKHRCESYTSFVYREDAVYRNADCALCNGIEVHQTKGCLDQAGMRVGAGRPFSSLFDVNRDSPVPVPDYCTDPKYNGSEYESVRAKFCPEQR